MKPLAHALLLLVVLAVPALAQRVEPPNEINRANLIVFTHSDWQQRPQEARLMSQLEGGKLAELKSKCNFLHYTSDEPVYASGRFYNVPENEFPVVILSDKDGYCYKASRTTLPSSGDAIWEQARQAYFQCKEARSDPSKAIDISQDCPDGMCPYQPQPPATPPADRQPVFPNAPWNADDQLADGIGGLFGPDTPIRDSLGYGAWLMGAVVAVFFLSIVFFGFIVIVALALYALKK